MNKSILIRQSTKQDLPEIISLLDEIFQCRHDPGELEWALTNPYKPSELNSYVALLGSQIVAHCGYILNQYQQQGKPLFGTHAIALCAKPSNETRGVGTQIFESVSTLKDFAIGYSGTAASTRSYKRFGGKTAGIVKSYQTTLNFPSLPELLYSKSAVEIIKLIRRSLKEKFRLKLNGVSKQELEFSDESIPSESELPKSDILQNTPTDETIAWLKQCPVYHEIVAKRIRSLDGRELGLLVLGTARVSNGLHGRIIHLPLLDAEPELWKETLQFALTELKSRGCSDATVCATHEKLTEVLESSGFQLYEERPVVFLDREKAIDETNIHLTFLEGDHHYRNM